MKQDAFFMVLELNRRQCSRDWTIEIQSVLCQKCPS